MKDIYSQYCKAVARAMYLETTEAQEAAKLKAKARFEAALRKELTQRTRSVSFSS